MAKKTETQLLQELHKETPFKIALVIPFFGIGFYNSYGLFWGIVMATLTVIFSILYIKLLARIFN